MNQAIPPLQPAELPPRQRAFWKMTGPGAVLVGLSIGAGEIIIWPRIAAEYGASMVWAAVLGVFIQMWINIEIGRWTIATGETAYAGYARVWRGFAVYFILVNFFGWFFPGWARASGAALKALLLGPEHPTPDWLWTGVTFLAVAAVLFGPKRIYATVERLVSTLVVIVTLGLIVVAVRVATADHVMELLRGVANVGYRDPGFTVKELFIAMVFAGAGGTANVFYSFYLRDKHIGMGARVPALTSPFRDRQVKPAQHGFLFPDDDANRRRFRDWFRYVVIDQVLYFWLLNTVTILLFIFGALAVLHPKGIVPASATLIWDEAMILADTMGPAGRYLFLLIGLATLFSTQVTLVDGVARSMADILYTAFPAARCIAESSWYAGWAIFMIVFGVAITALLERIGNVKTLEFLFNAAYVGGFAMAVYVPLTLFINLRYLPRGARPGWINITMMALASLLYVGFALYCIWHELTTRRII